jgi:hypothetical protein
MEDSTPLKDSLSEEATPENTSETTGLRLSARHDALLPISVVGGLLGMLAGTLPASVWVMLFGVSFAPMYVFMPLLIYTGIKVFKGSLDKRGFIVACILSVIGYYLTVLSCQAALDILKYKMLFTSLPLVTATLIGSSEGFVGPVLSPSYVFPALFTMLGILLVYELMHRKPEQAAAAEIDPDPDTE